jgi:hypothetical protein
VGFEGEFMKKLALFVAALAAASSSLLITAPAQAQATRTWVSGVGDDVNPCSRTAPCKTFAGAISKTAAGGEINCLDPGGYGTLTVTKSITVDCTGTLGSTLASGTIAGFTINDGATATPGTIAVILRNIEINGAGSTLGQNGIRVLSGSSLTVENVRIYNFSQRGINVEPTNAAGSTFRLSVIGTSIQDTAGGAILLKPGPGVFVSADVMDSSLSKSQYGVRAEDRAKASVRDSTAANNVGNGFVAVTTAAVGEIALHNVLSTGNGQAGVAAVGANAVIRISDTALHNNVAGIISSGGGQIVSAGNNFNSGSGAPTSTPGQQ